MNKYNTAFLYNIRRLSKETGIYSITNLFDGKQYIGSAAGKRGFESRIALHREHLLKNKHHSWKLQLAYLRCGIEAFEFEILELVEPEKCIEREQYWMGLLKPEYNINKRAGSNFGNKCSEATKIKMRNSALGRSFSKETREKMSKAKEGVMLGSKNPFYGRKHTDETKKKISETKIKQNALKRT